MIGAHQNLNGSCDLTTPFRAWFAIRGLALVTEVSNSTHYEDMKGDTKCRKWGGLGLLGALKVTGNSTNR